ncbi:hypothetical protein [Streptomyces fradiae]|uniref:hypothetical protein n=1 Tax=Streptomyces fradiae TaxID=1906 RepID=UPI00351837EF
MRLSVSIHRTRLGATEFTVIRPAQPLRRAVLIDRDRYLNAYVDEHAARRIGGLWALAATSPRTLIHLPMRGNQPPSAALSMDPPRRLDLVLLHHSLQFAPARWKELRGRLGPGRPRTVTLPDAGLEDASGIDDAARHHKENRDLFHQHLHAETVFMTGSTKVFRETTRHFLDVARHGPAHARSHPSRPHYCAELHSNDGTLGNARELHIEYCDEWNA